MTAYSTALLHISRHAYKRGEYKGEAPADCGNRRRNHFRMIAAPGRVWVRFHNANIITAYENGDIEFDARGWVDSPTTRAAFGDAIGSLKVCNISHPFSMRHRSARHTVVRAGGKAYVYYDGMRFNQMGELLTEARPFQEYRIDKEEAAELAAELKESGFTDMFKMIYATCQPDADTNYLHYSAQQLRDRLTANDRACDWPGIVAAYKYASNYRRSIQGQNTYYEKGNASKCRSAIMADLKRSMYYTKNTDVTVL